MNMIGSFSLNIDCLASIELDNLRTQIQDDVLIWNISVDSITLSRDHDQFKVSNPSFSFVTRWNDDIKNILMQ